MRKVKCWTGIWKQAINRSHGRIVLAIHTWRWSKIVSDLIPARTMFLATSAPRPPMPTSNTLAARSLQTMKYHIMTSMPIKIVGDIWWKRYDWSLVYCKSVAYCVESTHSTGLACKPTIKKSCIRIQARDSHFHHLLPVLATFDMPKSPGWFGPWRVRSTTTDGLAHFTVNLVTTELNCGRFDPC